MRPRLWCIEATVVAMENAGADIRPCWARGIDKFWGGPSLRVALNWQQMEEQDANKKIMKVLSKKKNWPSSGVEGPREGFFVYGNPQHPLKTCGQRLNIVWTFVVPTFRATNVGSSQEKLGESAFVIMLTGRLYNKEFSSGQSKQSAFSEPRGRAYIAMTLNRPWTGYRTHHIWKK